MPAQICHDSAQLTMHSDVRPRFQLGEALFFEIYANCPCSLSRLHTVKNVHWIPNKTWQINIIFLNSWKTRILETSLKQIASSFKYSIRRNSWEWKDSLSMSQWLTNQLPHHHLHPEGIILVTLHSSFYSRLCINE